jgi:hypothetical protein
MPKRFLNVQYDSLTAEVDITSMSRLGEVQDAIKAKLGEAIPVAAGLIQLYTNSNRDQLINTWALFNSLTEEYFTEGGCCVVIGTFPLHDAMDIDTESILQRNNTPNVDTLGLRNQQSSVIHGTLLTAEIDYLTTKLKTFANAKLVNECLQTPNNDFFPYPQKEIKKLYVRKCYVDLFDLLLEKITLGKKSFAISGTPGIGKSLFFVYILHLLMKDYSKKTLSLKPNRIVYQRNTEITCFDLENSTAVALGLLQARPLVFQKDTLYIIDGPSNPLSSACITLYISSPRSDQYKSFVKQEGATEWYFPVWTIDELQTCQCQCYPDLSIEILTERFRVYGGVARIVFDQDYSIKFPKTMEHALADVNAVKAVKNFCIPTSIFETTHTLLHIIVSNDGKFEFRHVDIASEYVGEQLWKMYYQEMILNLQEMFGGSPSVISRHIFEIFGHLVFSKGGQTLKCRCLEDDDDTISTITLDRLNSPKNTFGKNSIPTAISPASYYEPTDDDNFPAIDSFSPQGMFQFTVSAEHPIRGVDILARLCKLYHEPKLYFVVPPHQFEKFKRQSFKGRKGTTDVKSIVGLKQYVVELDLKKDYI